MSRDDSSRTKIFGAFVEAAPATLSMRAVVGLTVPLGLSPSNVRSHVTRMVQRGVLERLGPSGESRYRISQVQGQLVSTIKNRLYADSSCHKWDGRWLLLALRFADRETSAREKLRRDLRFAGFGSLGHGVYLRPLWPEADCRDNAAQLVSEHDATLMVGDIDGDPQLQAEALYSLDELDRRARKLTQRLHSLRSKVHTPRAAFKLRSQIGAEIAHLYSDDPLLPESLWNGRKHMRILPEVYRSFLRHTDDATKIFVDEILSAG